MKSAHEEEAIGQADKQNSALLDGWSIFPEDGAPNGSLEANGELTIKQAMIECIKSSRARERTKDGYRGHANAFLGWISR